jgi:hypothetical protein
MSDPRTIETYGGVFDDAEPVEDPTVEQSADYANRLHEDVAQLTRTTFKAWVKFVPTGVAAPTTVVASAGRSHMGTGGGNLPTIAKTGTGTYTITYPASWTDDTDEDEDISFIDGFAMVNGGNADVGSTAQIVSIIANVVVIKVYDETFTLADLSGTAWVTVALF